MRLTWPACSFLLALYALLACGDMTATPGPHAAGTKQGVEDSRKAALLHDNPWVRHHSLHSHASGAHALQHSQSAETAGTAGSSSNTTAQQRDEDQPNKHATYQSVADQQGGQQHAGSRHAARHLQQQQSNSGGKDIEDVQVAHGPVAICAIVRNEHGNMREWVRYHLWLGVSRVYLFDHNSHPPMAMELQDFVRMGMVELFYFNTAWKQRAAGNKQQRGAPPQSPQAWAYDSCFRWFGWRHKWIGLFDPDEFVVVMPQQQPSSSSTEKQELVSLLQQYSQWGGVMMHWRIIGPSGHVDRPSQPAPLAYTRCVGRAALMNWTEFQTLPMGHMKSFTATQYYAGGGCNPHQCVLRSGAPPYVSEDMKPISPRVALEASWSKLVVYHYVTRSAVDYQRKVDRGSGHSQYIADIRARGIKSRGWRYFKLIERMAQEECTDAALAYTQCCHAGACTCRHSNSSTGAGNTLTTSVEAWAQQLLHQLQEQEQGQHA